MISICPRLSLAKRARRNACAAIEIAGAPHVDHPCAEFLDRRPCFAAAQVSRGQRQTRRTRLDRVRRICTQHIAGRCIERNCSCRARCFEILRVLRNGWFSKSPLCCGGGSTICIDDDEGRAGMRAGRRERQSPHNNREGTMPLASTAADRGSRANDGTARRVLRAQNSRPDGAGLWNRPYTLWRADRPAICGRNAVAALIRKAKPPARSCGKSSLFAGTADKAH